MQGKQTYDNSETSGIGDTYGGLRLRTLSFNLVATSPSSI
ncbi:hypothetical protein OSCI_3280043 [Kamptonema sp. PCC 6506]|nr:hypothetical protein OSCI_3280043 [Kamptonema sp. PCC 6506]